MDLETDLRTALGDSRHELVPPPHATETIVRNVCRRRRRRTVTWAAAGLIVVAVGVPVALRVSPSDSTVVTADGTVGWVAEPLAQAPQLARRSPRPAAPACDPAKLNPTIGYEDVLAADGTMLRSVVVTNRTDRRCTLSGIPTVKGTLTSTGARTTVVAYPVADEPGELRQYPATIDPGEAARVDVTKGSAGCDATELTDVVLEFGARSFPASPKSDEVMCAPRAGSWYVRPPLLNAPVMAKISAPAQVRRGETFDYTVELTNGYNRTFSYGGCPAYRQEFAGSKGWFRLNCGPRKIGPHSSVTYAMRATVPKDAEKGGRLTWMAAMPDGEVVIANLDTGGVPVEIVK
ncbi:DUF4232 domain-containing protein [Actinoplanes friuliensis]|uniref:DUF4232 domain-containing protein n=1 Tax=Actinoplanes friuliensis DSM 7358 TaxID=1246995 RepID=U5VPG2_9ACTN|nr:DUF4232 domain-containing protein [Actinoplanes friuliensis]AGZ38858.1 hypothetical protein AFR_02845 [Actinoplanes friuliensis DSM 7358]